MLVKYSGETLHEADSLHCGGGAGGIIGPARMPPAVVAKLNAAILNVLRVPDVREQMARQGLDPIGSSPAEFAAHLQRETTRWARVVKDAGIKAD